MKKSKPGRLVIVTDPPFGGRCELVANTYKTIMNDFAEAHDKVEAEKCRVEMIWIFPYFMEHQVIFLILAAASTCNLRGRPQCPKLAYLL